MGVGRAAIALLLEESLARPFSGRLATLGRQTIRAAPKEILAQFARFGTIPRTPLGDGEPDDQSLFRMMGFSSIESLDYSDFEDATHTVDLNQNSLPPNLIGRFDVVLDSGTIEHVFHVPNALGNALNLAKEGGRVIFLSPSSNHVDHGFYMFSPTLFMDYLLANGLRIETSYFIRYSVDPRKPWRAYAYDRDSWRQFTIGALDGRPYMNFIVATRVPGSSVGKVPQQSLYAARWNAPGPASPGRHDRLKRVLRRVPGGLALATAVWTRIVPRGRRGLRFVGDY